MSYLNSIEVAIENINIVFFVVTSMGGKLKKSKEIVMKKQIASLLAILILIVFNTAFAAVTVDTTGLTEKQKAELTVQIANI